MFSISHDFTYLLYEDQIYHMKENRLLKEEEMTYDFWLTFIKENLVSSYVNEIMDEVKVKSIIRGITTSFSRNISENFNTYHSLKVERTLSINLTKENVSEVVEESFKLMNMDNLLTEAEFNEAWYNNWNDFKGAVSDAGKAVYDAGKAVVDTAVDGVKAIGGAVWDGFEWVGKQFSNAWEWLKEVGIKTFFEGLRSALYSWGGIAVQTFLSSIGALTAGIGPAINMIVWGAMLIYDLTNAIAESDWGFDSIFNIIIDIIGVVTTGPGAGAVVKAVGGSVAKVAAKGAQIMKAAGAPIQGAAGKFVQVFAGLSKTSVGRTIGKVVTWLTSKLSSLFSRLGKAAQWFKDTFGSSFLKRGIDKVSKFLSKISNGLSTIFKTTKSGAQAVSKASTDTMTKGLQSTGVKSATAKTLSTATKDAVKQGAIAAGIIGALGGDMSTFGDGGEAALAAISQKEMEKQMAALGIENFDNVEMTPDQLAQSSDDAYDELSDV